MQRTYRKKIKPAILKSIANTIKDIDPEKDPYRISDYNDREISDNIEDAIQELYTKGLLTKRIKFVFRMMEYDESIELMNIYYRTPILLGGDLGNRIDDAIYFDVVREEYREMNIDALLKEENGK